jgi:hypothetical protein
MDNLTQMTMSAHEYAPFFFAVLYSVVIPTMAYRWYSASNSRQRPNMLEQRTTRLWFLTTTYFGFFLVVAAIAWFIYVHARSVYTYEGFVVDLKMHEAVESSEFFSRPEVIGRQAELRDLHFVIKRSRPFRTGERIRLHFYEQPMVGGTDEGAKPPPQEIWLDVIEPGDTPQRFAVRRRGNVAYLERLPT